MATALDTFIKQTEQYTNNLAREALIDPLTGLLNRRNLEKLMKQWMFESEEFTLLIMDIDRFKIINDTYGHNTGDIILIHLAALLQNTVRKDDICFRFGGEEFVVLIKGTPLSEAYALSEKIRIAFETNENPIGKTCTLSLGLAHYPSQAEEPTELLKLADQALYEAKRRGRNQSCVFE
ncbi:GGDEF domain-containing protein [Paenibacillus sp. DMB20]|uniref:GGDEF domain-containing protein n=1 Tax=Paenibacillus sp. DMB20 TaxID=1642570 RepID=UPI00069C0A44|nr:GGDEF domain-containing protein [Paenibacillus sp. DMB20]